MDLENEINIGGVLVVFQMSLHVGTITSSQPTEFTQDYLKILAGTAGEHFMKQMAEAMVERIQEDLEHLPKDKVWVPKT